MVWIALVSVLAGFLLIGGILVVAFLPRREAGLGVRSAPGPEGTWNASVHTGMLGDTTGRQGLFDVTAGWLSFTPTGAQAPVWRYPCPSVGVRAGSGFRVHPVTLQTPDGLVEATVSQERINRFSGNTMKTARESGYADEFARVLIAAGARPL